MKKKASELRNGDAVIIGGKKCIVENIEISEIGKQGTRKARLELKTEDNEKIVIIRPEDYPFEFAQDD